MSVVINTNSAASIAAGNLASANDMLRKSLNRLSSGSKIVNASDDAGGVAVASRLEAGAKRAQAANSGIGNAVAYLQNQDSVLKTLTKLATRMNELQMMYRDSSLGTTDKANYTVEFNALRARYESIRNNQVHNGINLAKSGTNLAVTVNEAGTTYTLSDLDSTTGSSGARVTDLSGSAITDGASFASDGTAGTFATNAGTSFTVNGYTITGLTASAGLAATVSSINSHSNQTRVQASVDTTGTKLILSGLYAGESFVITANALTAAWGITTDSTTNKTVTASTAADATKAAVDELSGARAKNGADQNALGFYVELGQATITNFESAVSRIMDVDVAHESTQLARWQTLVQAGTAMLAQANGSTVSALSLLKG